ncbi:MAG: DNA polymerase III subunits gamma and tau [Firmicutes bacterium]|nr:DNA polymerase III subunits gamma and tau [Bacillota bacterium]MDI6705506.1 DNA polymerase III subunit gamma/tau [Bacillota bacterium]
MVNMSYTALYRQYRPKVFEEVIGQEHISTILRNQITGGRVAHAYLFTGTRGTGKTSTAKIFARAVNCLDNSRGNPCNVCTVCKMDLEGKLIDVVEIDAASNRGVDEIRDLREKVKYPPAEGKYRVYIIDEVHMLTAEAFNALLKTLEEPPAHVIFILATTEPQKLPATILSRCQRFDFKRISVDDIAARLKFVLEKQGLEAEEGAIQLIAETADGAMRDALSVLDQCAVFQEGRLTVEHVVSVLGMAGDGYLFDLSKAVLNSDAAGCIEIVDTIVREGKDIGQLFKDTIQHFRDIMIAKVSPEGLKDISQEKRDRLTDLAGSTGLNPMIRAINTLSEAEAKAKWSSQPRIFLEVALIKLCEPSMDSSVEGMEERISRLEELIFNKNDAINNNSAVGQEKKAIQEHKASKAEETVTGSVEKETLTFDTIAGRWGEVLKYLERNKKGLYTLLQHSKPLEVKGTCLVIGCESLHGIYYDIANSKDNIDALKKAVNTIIDSGLDVRIENLSSASGPPSGEVSEEGPDLVEEAKRIFGEDLVEVIDEEDSL